MRINNGGPAASLDSIVLFPFDDHSIPFQHGVKLSLRGKQAGHGNKPAVPLGEAGAHDSLWIAYYDFEHWADATCSGLRRSNVSPQPLVAGKNTGEQVHLGAALWNRGNVIVGFFGKWNGHPSNDRRMVTMDLGLAVSNDALHYREPIPDFPIVSAAEDSWGLKRRESLALNFPALIQGQGFENVGDETLFWYAPWPEEASDGVRVTSWPRDRLGYFSPYESGIWVYAGGSDPHFVSAPIDLEGSAARLAVNVEGINEHSSITVEIQDHAFRPAPGYDRGSSQSPAGPGLAQPLTWQGHDVIDGVTARSGCGWTSAACARKMSGPMLYISIRRDWPRLVFRAIL